MAHQHSVYDTDKHFLIDPITREIINQTPDKIQLMQGDHNSERFTFEIAKVDGHDMSKCDKIEVHFLNVAADKTGQNSDVYPVEDIQISPIDSDVIIFSWLVSNNATQFAGTLNFVIRFICLTGETIDYVWNTGIFKGISVGEGMNNSEGVIADYSDVLEAWRQDLFEAGGESVANVNMARDEALSAIQEEKAAQIEAIETKGAEVLAAIPEEYGTLNENVEANSANIEEMQKIGDKHSSLISRHDKRIKTLEGAVYGDLAKVKEDNTVAYIKNVPSSALGTAKIRAIGGMTRKCANLWKPFTTQSLNGVALTVNADGVCTLNGACSESANFSVNGGTLPAGTYWLSDNAQGTFPNNNYARVQVYFESGLSLQTENNHASNKTAVMTLKEPTSYSRRIRIEEGHTYSNCKLYPMLNAGTTALPYEPYFEGLRSAPAEKVESVGANLFDIDNYNVYAGYITGGYIKAFDRCKLVYMRCQPNTTYTVSKCLTARFDVGFTNEIPSAEVSVLNSASDMTGTKATLTANSPDNAKYIVIWFYHADHDTLTPEEILATLMVNKGTTAQPYTPYVKHTLPIPAEVRAKDGYGDGINKDVNNHIRYEDDGKRTWNRRVGKVDLGTLDWTLQSTFAETTFTAPFAEMKKPADYSERVTGFICAKYPPSSNVNYTTLDDGCMVRADGLIIIRDTAYSDAATFKAAMSGVMLVYELATPEVTDISDILPADNYIEVEGGGTLTFKNEYEYDVPSEVTFVTKEASA